ncbi:MAG: PH domain-containing protein [Ruminococcus sp.]|uniref:PH domain-containing protein n=1 Tax=Ruminococcus sp. TaxID=41978 RepID=UPI0025E2F400|nr:PH domain-containing protein [Ruminococcus sp.]MCR5601857.1 PH domain-containing protein [Ruminococcus sp.]
MYREHPLKILKYSAKNIWLLIFPLIRGIYTYHFDKDWFYSWVKGAWFDIAVLGAIILFGFMRWVFSRIDFTREELVHRDGIFIRVNTYIPYKNVSSVTVERPVYLAPFRAVRFRCDTRAGIFKTVDLKLLVSRKTLRAIMHSMPDIDDEKKIKGIPQPTSLSVLLFSIFFSSGFSGTVYLATFFFKGGDIAYKIISRSLNILTAETEKITDNLVLKIPTAAIFIGVFFIASWFLSFIVNIFRYGRFTVECDKKCMKVGYGIIDHKEYRIKNSHINYTDLRQNIIMKLMGAVAVNISCAGYGASKNRLPVLLPVKLEKSLGTNLQVIGIYSGIKNQYRAQPAGIGSYLLNPLIAAAVIIPLHDMFVKLFPRFAELSFFVAVMLEIPAVWFIIVKFVALMTSGVTLYDDKIMIRCSSWTKFHTVVSERDKIVKLELHQNYLQAMSGRCAMCIWFEGEEHKRLKIKAMKVEEVREIEKILGHRLGEKVRA